MAPKTDTTPTPEKRKRRTPEQRDADAIASAQLTIAKAQARVVRRKLRDDVVGALECALSFAKLEGALSFAKLEDYGLVMEQMHEALVAIPGARSLEVETVEAPK